MSNFTLQENRQGNRYFDGKEAFILDDRMRIVAIGSMDTQSDRDAMTLLAAAPALLAACRAVVEEDGFHGSALMRKRIEQMKAAIQLAEGTRT